MMSTTARSGGALTTAYDFSGIGRLIDVGGGHFLLLAAKVQAHPSLRGVLFDLRAGLAVPAHMVRVFVVDD